MCQQQHQSSFSLCSSNYLYTRISVPSPIACKDAVSVASTAATSAARTGASFLATSSTWFASALLGYLLDVKVLRDTGISATLTVSAIICPPSPLLDRLCWNTFLPASLALLLLSLTDDEEDMNTDLSTKNDSPNNTTTETAISAFESFMNEMRNDDRNSISQSVKRLAVPFVLASLGSFLGGILTFPLCCTASAIDASTGVTSWSSWLLPPEEARVALSCLTASFIGGSVNFFSTANFIQGSSLSSSPLSSMSTATALMGSMAKANLIIMAIYFSLLSAALSSRT
ncbi:hypothetical protein ACA910_021958 [Epithemia clementina (nom. ined.)]